MSVEEHIAALKSKHAELESQLDSENHRPHPATSVLPAIQPQTLRIKDALAQLGGR